MFVWAPDGRRRLLGIWCSGRLDLGWGTWWAPTWPQLWERNFLGLAKLEFLQMTLHVCSSDDWGIVRTLKIHRSC